MVLSSVSPNISRKIFIIGTTLLFISPAFALGDGARNLLLIIAMGISPILFLFYPIIKIKTDLPLINYAIGDKGTCEVRDGVRYITSVQGRMNDFFRYETGEVTTFFEIAPIIAHCEDILQMRFIQETYHKIHIQCVHNIAESKLTKEEVEKDMTAKLNAKFKHPFEIEYEWMDSIPPDKNGKLRMIVCKVQD